MPTGNRMAPLLVLTCTVLVLTCTVLVGPVVAQENQLFIPDQRVVPGQAEVWVPVEATNSEPMQGFQILARYDSEILNFRRHTLDFTVIATLEPEFLQVNNRQTHLEVGCLFDFIPPLDNRALGAGRRARVLHFVFDVAENAAPGTETQVRLVNEPQLSQVLNIFTVSGQSISPELRSGTLTVAPPQEGEILFLRGDIDGNNRYNLVDVLFVLNYLFANGRRPVCLDAADFEDVGRVNLGSVLALVNYIFQGGPPPSLPFPVPGLDPSEDGLANCGE